MIIKARRPPPVVHFGYRIAGRDEQLPKFLEVFGPGESTGRSDDRNGFVSHSVRTKSTIPGRTSATFASLTRFICSEESNFGYAIDPGVADPPTNWKIAVGARLPTPVHLK